MIIQINNNLITFLTKVSTLKSVIRLLQTDCFSVKTSRLLCQDFGHGVPSSSRCDLRSKLESAGCALSALESPNSKLKVIEDRPLSNKATVNANVTQIKPQNLHITLRPGELLHLLFRSVMEEKFPTYWSKERFYFWSRGESHRKTCQIVLHCLFQAMSTGFPVSCIL